jgi:hypothetical protein
VTAATLEPLLTCQALSLPARVVTAGALLVFIGGWLLSFLPLVAPANGGVLRRLGAELEPATFVVSAPGQDARAGLAGVPGVRAVADLPMIQVASERTQESWPVTAFDCASLNRVLRHDLPACGGEVYVAASSSGPGRRRWPPAGVSRPSGRWTGASGRVEGRASHVGASARSGCPRPGRRPAQAGAGIRHRSQPAGRHRRQQPHSSPDRSGGASSSWRPWYPPWWEAWSPWPGARWRPSRAPVSYACRHPRQIHPAASSSPSQSGDGSARTTGPSRPTDCRENVGPVKYRLLGLVHAHDRAEGTGRSAGPGVRSPIE